MSTTRRAAWCAVLALLASLLVVTGAAAPAGAISAGTIDGGPERFVVPGPVTVSGTDPGFTSGTVTVTLGGTFSGNVWVPTVIGTGTVSADGTWTVAADTGPQQAGSLQLSVMVPDAGGAQAQLMQRWWFRSPASDLVITSPTAGATITSSASDCLTLTGHMASSPLNLQPGAGLAYGRFGDTVVYGDISAGPGPGDVTACLPARLVPDGPVTVWMLVSDGTTSRVASTQATVDLTTTASLTGYGNGNWVSVVGAVHDAGPDLAFTATFDGATIPFNPILGTVAHPEQVLVDRGVDVFAWTNAHTEQTTTQLVADGPHEFHVSMTSRGVTTDLGGFPVTVVTDGRLTVDAGSVAGGALNLSGHYDNLPSPFAGQPLSAVVTVGGVTFTDTTHESVTDASPSQYGRNTWALTGLALPGGQPSGPVDVTVKGLDHHAVWTCVRVSITGTTVTPIPCDALPPAPPAAASVTASGIRAANVNLTPPTTDGGSPITGYTVDITPDFNASLRTRLTSTGTSTSIPLPVPWMSDTTVEVRAVTAVGSSEPVVLRLITTYPQITSSVRSVPLGARWPFSVSAFSSAHPASTPVQVQYRALPTAAWRTVLSTSVGADATVPLSLVPTASGYYRVVSLGQGQVLGFESAPIALTVVPKPPVAIKASATTVALRGRVTISGASIAGERGNRAVLQRLVGRRWVALVKVPVASTGRFAVALRTTSRGTFAYRWVLPAWHGNPVGASRAVAVRVR